MKTKIKKLSVEMELKNKGMEIEIRNNKDVFLGDLVIRKSGMVWCQGRTTAQNGRSKSWEEIIAFFNQA